MTDIFDEEHFTTDAARVVFHETDGVTVDEEEGTTEFDWDSVERVKLDDVPHADAFETKEFYKLPATVARPIKQPYSFGVDEEGNRRILWLKKPRDELKRAAWSLDNAPWTLGHPETPDRMVRSVDDIRGFFRNPRYIDSLDDLDADLHLPVNDEEAKDYVERNGDVSVGFFNKHARIDEYDGVVGGADDKGDDLDGYQIDMYFNHVASVPHGRCSGEQGCGIDSLEDGATHGHAFISGTLITNKDRGMGGDADESDFVNPDDGDWYAIPPSDNTDDEWKFPINNCSDVQDAWKLRGHGDISVDQSTLEERIKRRASSLDCDVPDSDALDDAEVDDYQIVEPEADCGCGDDKETDNTNMVEFEITTDDLTPEAVLAQVRDAHDGVDEYLEELNEAAERAEAYSKATEAAEVDDDTDLSEYIESLRGEVDELREFKEQHEADEARELAEFIAERTDRFGEDADEIVDSADGLEQIAEWKEIVEDLTETTDEKPANAGDETETPSDQIGGRPKYVATPWE